MSMFLPEAQQQQPVGGVVSVTPSSPETTGEDVALMQRVLAAAARNPNLIPSDFMAYLIDYVQTARLSIPIGQVFGYQRIAPQVITDFGQVPNPVDGQIILLKVGSASPFIYVQMMYDQNAAQWVSEEFSAGGGSATGLPTTNTDIGGKAGISWAPVHKAGLTMQLKWSGTRLTDVGTTAATGISLTFGNLTSSETTATMSETSSAGTGAVEAVGSDWATVTDPGDFNMVAIGLYIRRISGTNGTTVSAGVVGRFLK